MTNELTAVEALVRRLPPAPAGEVWIGDDAAVLRAPHGVLLLAADTVVEGVHADLSVSTVADLGYKALARNVSDIAAMGGEPGHAVVSVVGPPDTDLGALYRGLAEASDTYACPVVGGDLANGPVLVVTVAVTGHVTGDSVRRSGARPHDVLYVTGPLGASAASGWRRRPRARVEEGQAARRAGATAMIDVSDGLVADLNHLAEASGVGYVLGGVPVAPGATEHQALHGGDDYELLFTGPPDLPVGTPIGTCTADRSQRVPSEGWEHDFR